MPYQNLAIRIFILSGLLISTQMPSVTNAADQCGLIFRTQKQLTAARHRMSQSDKSTTIERREKILTNGERASAAPDMDIEDIRIDSADPSLVMPIHYGNGITKYRINFSGMRYIETDHPGDFFRGGVRHVEHSRGFYADGTEMTGPYHNASWPWDVVIYKNDQGENIALGGVMKQPGPGLLPNVQENNRTRSRWWGKVKHVVNSNGKLEEHIIWQGPVHDFNQNNDPNSWLLHGYGGTLLTKFNPATGENELVKNKRGNYILFYERVTEEKEMPNGIKMPWVTTMFSREMDPSMTHTVGEEVPVTSVKSAVTQDYFKAMRRGDENQTDGYLAEGGNVLMDLQTHSYVKAFSANDYTREYGIYLDYLPKGSNPQSLFKPVVDKNGELIDFATKMHLRELMHATWLGRPQLIHSPDGKLWLLFHFVPVETIPPGGPFQGWPTKEAFVKYGRITAMVPVRLETLNEQPNLVLDIDPRFDSH